MLNRGSPIELVLPRPGKLCRTAFAVVYMVVLPVLAPLLMLVGNDVAIRLRMDRCISTCAQVLVLTQDMVGAGHLFVD